MRTDLYWIPGPWPGRLAIMPRPRGGDWLEDEIRAWQRAGVSVVVSLLTDDEIAALELGDEQRHCESAGLWFYRLPIPDRGVPPKTDEFAALVASLDDRLANGAAVAIHCRQGIGRAALVAIALLVTGGTEVETAIRQASEARTCGVPETREQRQWLVAFAASRTALAK
jgi:protein-tyrosine phosphatase